MDDLIDVYRKYILDVLKYNVLLSIVFSITLSVGMQINILHGFFVSLVSGGFIGGLYLFRLLQINEYYFYYNLGLTKTQLNLASGLVNIVIFIVGETVLIMAKQMI